MVEGSNSAHASIFCGLKEAKKLGCAADDIVAIHDGVRPIINNKTINASIESAQKYGSGITSFPAYETISCVDNNNNEIDYITNRDKTFTLQAPQSFNFEYIYNLNIKAQQDGVIGKVVDQAQLCFKYGERPHLIRGLRGNVKITVMLDYINFKNLVESGYYEEIIADE